MDLTEHLIRRLKAAKITPTQLAEHINVSVPFASQILSGKRGIRLTHVKGIASLLGMTISALFESDLPSHLSDAQSRNQTEGTVHSSKTTPPQSSPEDHRAGTAPISPEQLDAVIGELLGTAEDVQQLNARISERIAMLIERYPRATLLQRQAAVARLSPPVHVAGDREHDRQPQGKGRRPRKTG